jgi:hypothetical protein
MLGIFDFVRIGGARQDLSDESVRVECDGRHGLL